MREVLVNRLGGLSLPRKSVVGLTDSPDMILDVYRGRKSTTQQRKYAFYVSDICRCTSYPVYLATGKKNKEFRTKHGIECLRIIIFIFYFILFYFIFLLWGGGLNSGPRFTINVKVRDYLSVKAEKKYSKKKYILYLNVS